MQQNRRGASGCPFRHPVTSRPPLCCTDLRPIANPCAGDDYIEYTKDPSTSVTQPSAYAVNLNFSRRFGLLLFTIAELSYLIRDLIYEQLIRNDAGQILKNTIGSVNRILPLKVSPARRIPSTSFPSRYYLNVVHLLLLTYCVCTHTFKLPDEAVEACFVCKKDETGGTKLRLYAQCKNGSYCGVAHNTLNITR